MLVRLGCGPDGAVGGRKGQRATLLFCLWLAWSRFRVVIPTWDRTLPTLLSCVDTSLRRLGGAPTYALTDNEKTVTVEHVARVAVRHPEIVAAGRHYGMQVATSVPFDPESKGGSEASVRVAKADLVPTEANLLDAYPDMAALVAACGRVLCAGQQPAPPGDRVRCPSSNWWRSGRGSRAALGALCRRARGDPVGQH